MRPRRPALLFLGAVLARGQRTVTSWIRAARLSDQFRPCYTAVVAAGRIKGGDLRRHEPAPTPVPVLTLGQSTPWVYQAGQVRITVSGYGTQDELVSALNETLRAARTDKQSLAGGLGR